MLSHIYRPLALKCYVVCLQSSTDKRLSFQNQWKRMRDQQKQQLQRALTSDETAKLAPRVMHTKMHNNPTENL